MKSPLGLSSLWDLQRIDRPDLKYPPLVQAAPAALDGAEAPDIFAAIRQRDILLHHPYDSFDPVVDFVTRGRRRPGRAGHQDDALPRGPQRAGRRRAHGGGRQRQAGRRARRAQGALRRGEQHRLGQGARARGRARRLRPRRPQDALQDHARRAPRRRPHPPLRAPRHRQLQQRHHEAVHRPRLPHLRRGPRRRRLRGLQLSSPGYSTSGDYRKFLVAPATHARAASRSASTARSSTPERGGGAPHLQDELAGRQADDPPAVPRLAGGRQGRAQRARHVLPAARRPRGQREHHRAQHRRAASSSTAASTGSATAARRRSSGQRRPHAAQPQPPRRDPLPGAGPGHPAAPARRDPARLPGRQHEDARPARRTAPGSTSGRRTARSRSTPRSGSWRRRARPCAGRRRSDACGSTSCATARPWSRADWRDDDGLRPLTAEGEGARARRGAAP